MYIEELLEVVVGLVFVWLTLALASMGIQEWIAGLLKFRSRDLERTIREMLENPPSSVDPDQNLLNRIGQRMALWLERLGITLEGFFFGRQPDFVDGLYKHPLIRALSTRGREKPSYIPAHTFALALFDIVMDAGTEASAIKQALETMRARTADLQGLIHVAPTQFDSVLAKLIALADQADQDAIKLAELKVELAAFKSDYGKLRPVFEALMETDKFQQGLETLEKKYSNSTVKSALDNLITAAETYAKSAEDMLVTARVGVETWFNDTMDRLSGQYKRRAQVIGIAIGVALAVFLNVDAVLIATTLWREPLLRQALVEKAEQFELPAEEGEAKPSELIEAFSAEFEGLRLPIGWVAADLEADESGAPQKCTWMWWEVGESDVWGIGSACWVPLDAPQGMPKEGSYLWPKILGWLISGVASAQGAPFWFDVLKKITNVRMAGANPAEKPEAKKGEKA